MAFPPIAPIFAETTSVDSIMESEAAITQCKAALFCAITGALTTLFNSGTLNDEQFERFVEITKAAMNGFACMDQAIAAVIAAIAKKICCEQGQCCNQDNDCN